MPAGSVKADYFLKLTGIQGESIDSAHKNEIDVLQWGWGASNSGDAAQRGGHGVGKVSVQEMHVTMQMNKASPLIMEKCATGTHIDEAVLVCRVGGADTPQEYLKITLTKVLITRYETGGSDSDVRPLEKFEMAFAKIKMEYKPQDDKGKLGAAVTSTYNVAENQKE